MPYHNDMAAAVVRSTYTPDEENVPKLDPTDAAIPRANRIEALNALQASLRLSSETAASWVRANRDERHSSARAAGQSA